MVAGAWRVLYCQFKKTNMSTVIIYRANAKTQRLAEYNKRANVVFDNAIDPKDKATLEELKRKLKKAADEGTDAEFKAAQKQYDEFVDKLKSK